VTAYSVTRSADPHPRCGSYTGFNRHKKAGEEACEPCRLARNEYHRTYRSRPEVKAKRLAAKSARERALTRLGREYPHRLRQLLWEETRRDR
jgi:hypothetical protein